MGKLKPCPLCGGEAVVETCELTDGWMGGVECTKCGCCVVTDGLPTSEEAKAKIIEHWNTRYEPPSPHGIIVPAGNERLKGNKGGNIMTYPIRRDLDGCFFRVQREGKWMSICWTDLTEDERMEFAKDKDNYWLRRMLEYITQQYRETGDHLDIYCGDYEED